MPSEEMIDKPRDPIWMDGFLYGCVTILALFTTYSLFYPLIFSLPSREIGVTPNTTYTISEDTSLLIERYGPNCIDFRATIHTTGHEISGIHCRGNTISLEKWDLKLKEINTLSKPPTIILKKKRKYVVPRFIPAALISLIVIIIKINKQRNIKDEGVKGRERKTKKELIRLNILRALYEARPNYIEEKEILSKLQLSEEEFRSHVDYLYGTELIIVSKRNVDTRIWLKLTAAGEDYLDENS